MEFSKVNHQMCKTQFIKSFLFYLKLLFLQGFLYCVVSTFTKFQCFALCHAQVSRKIRKVKEKNEIKEKYSTMP